MASEIEMLYQFFRSNRIHKEEAHPFIRRKLVLRNKLKPKHVQSLLFSLEKLIHVAEKYGVVLAIENSYHYHELPTFDDFKVIFSEFHGGPIGYWHDTGHVHANEVLTLLSPGALLKKYSDHLAGFHFHDAIGLEDHMAPGKGEINFSKIQPYINSQTPIVIELKPGTPDVDISSGIRFLGIALCPGGAM